MPQRKKHNFDTNKHPRVLVAINQEDWTDAYFASSKRKMLEWLNGKHPDLALKYPTFVARGFPQHFGKYLILEGRLNAPATFRK